MIQIPGPFKLAPSVTVRLSYNSPELATKKHLELSGETHCRVYRSGSIVTISVTNIDNFDFDDLLDGIRGYPK